MSDEKIEKKAGNQPNEGKDALYAGYQPSEIPTNEMKPQEREMSDQKIEKKAGYQPKQGGKPLSEGYQPSESTTNEIQPPPPPKEKKSQ